MYTGKMSRKMSRYDEAHIAADWYVTPRSWIVLYGFMHEIAIRIAGRHGQQYL